MRVGTEHDMTSEDDAHTFDVLAEQFAELVRQGQAPDVEAWAAQHPDDASEIRALFPLIARIENAAAQEAPESLSPPTDRVGQSLGEYRILREVGRGGMGVVYEAEQIALGRHVALKVLPPSLTLDSRFVERFQQEARAAARLTHPHLVPVIDYGEADGVHYYAMQFIKGCGLDDLAEAVRELERADEPWGDRPLNGGRTDEQPDSTVAQAGALARRLTTDDVDPSMSTSAGSVSSSSTRTHTQVGARYFRNVARLLLDASDAVAYAHGQGVLHRDIKPSNLMLEASGVVRVTDFGICKDIDEEGEGVTKTGDVLGTYRYMAPERLEGVSDERGDVYGLGITLYELLTRKRAYGEENRAALIARIVQGPPPRPRALDSSIPADLETIVRKAIDHDYERRYQTAAALSADLRAFLERRPITARAPTLRYTLQRAVSRHKSITATVVAALIALVAGGIWYVRGVQQSEATAHRERTRAEAERADAQRQSYRASIMAAGAAVSTSDSASALRLLTEVDQSQRGWEWHLLRCELDSTHASIEGIAKGMVARLQTSPSHRFAAVMRYGADTELYDLESESLVATRPSDQLIDHVAWDPSEKHVVIGSATGVRIHDWPSLEPGKRLLAAEKTFGVLWSKDGKYIVVARERTLVTYDAMTGVVIASFPISSNVMGIVQPGDQPVAAVAFTNGSCTAWSFLEGKSVWQRQIVRSTPRDFVALNPTTIAIANRLDPIQLVDVSTGVTHRSVKRPAEGGAFCAHPSGRELVFAESGLLSLHTLAPRKPLWKVRGAPQRLAHLTTSHQGRRVWAPLPDGGLCCWYLGHRDRDFRSMRGHPSPIKSLAFNASGDQLASGGLGSTVRIWDIESGHQLRTLIGHHDAVTGTAYTNDGDVLSVCGRARLIRWDVDAGTPRWSVQIGNEGIRAMGLDRQRNAVVTGDRIGRLRRWDPATGEPLGEPKTIAEQIKGLTLSTFGLGAATDEQDRLFIFDSTSLEVLASLGHKVRAKAMDWKHAEPTLIFTTHAGSTHAWSQASDTTVELIAASVATGTPEVVDTLAVRPGDDRFLTGTRGGSVHVFRVADGALLLTRRESDIWVRCLAWTPDGELAVSGDFDGLLRIWSSGSVQRFTKRRERVDRKVRALVPRAKALAVESGRIDLALSRVDTLKDLAPDQREIIRLILHHQLGSPHAIAKYVLHIAEHPGLTFHEYAVGAALGRLLRLRASSHDSANPKFKAYAAAASIRADFELVNVAEFIGRVARHVHTDAVILAWLRPFQVLAYVKLDDQPAAREALVALDALWERNESVRNKSNEALRAEARAAVEAMAKK